VSIKHYLDFLHLLLKRYAFKASYVVGRLSLNSEAFALCETLEPTKYIIPPGIYELGLDPMYGAFKGEVYPILKNVPGRSQIQIHPGNKPSDSQGCILVGLNLIVGGLTNSTVYARYLTSAIRCSKKAQIEIREER
jgi:hypothetical protein